VNTPFHRRAGAALLACALLLAAPVRAEREPVLRAADLVDPSLLAGPGFRVDPEVRLRGLQAQFTVHTDWGVLAAESVEMLALRVGEMPAVSALYARDLSEALVDAGIDEVLSPAAAAGAIGRDPLGRLARLPGGILRYFETRLQSLGDRARRLGDRVDRAISHDGSPYGGLSTAAAPAKEDEPWWDKPVDELGRMLRSESGHRTARRKLAEGFGIDPGTSNPLLRARLDQLAWAIAGQRLAYDYALNLAAPGVAQVIGEIARIDDLTREPPPEAIRRRNEQRLEGWSADPDLRYRLAWRGAFSPTLLAELLDQLERLAPRRGGEALLEQALMARSEAEARYLIQSLRLLQAPRAESSGRGELLALGNLVGFRDDSGEFVLPLAVDRLSWIGPVRDWFDHVQVAQHPRRTVLVAGDISPRAQRAITRRGWSLLPHVDYPGAPPYLRPGAAH
jgi:hypothetical protein